MRDRSAACYVHAVCDIVRSIGSGDFCEFCLWRNTVERNVIQTACSMARECRWIIHRTLLWPQSRHGSRMSMSTVTTFTKPQQLIGRIIHDDTTKDVPSIACGWGKCAVHQRGHPKCYKFQWQNTIVSRANLIERRKSFYVFRSKPPLGAPSEEEIRWRNCLRRKRKTWNWFLRQKRLARFV